MPVSIINGVLYLPERDEQKMTVSRRLPTPRLSVLCLAVATLALVFMSCYSAATLGLDHSSGPTSTQAEQPTQQPTSQAGAPDTGEQTPTMPTPSPISTKQPEATTEVRPAGHSSIPFIQVSAGAHHTCGLRADGDIVCWGAHGDDERLTESTGLLDSPPAASPRSTPDTITPAPYARTAR